MSTEYYEGYATFSHYNGSWHMSVFDDKPTWDVGDRLFRVRVSLPPELQTQRLEGEASAAEEDDGCKHPEAITVKTGKTNEHGMWQFCRECKDCGERFGEGWSSYGDVRNGRLVDE